VQASLHASWFADGRVQPTHVVQHLPGVAVRDAPEARAALLQYFDTAVRQRAVAEIGAWKAYYAARTHLT
jgi:hypothetical protein